MLTAFCNLVSLIRIITCACRIGVQDSAGEGGGGLKGHTLRDTCFWVFKKKYEETMQFIIIEIGF